MNVQRGMRGESVAKIQQKLKDLGLYTSTVDSAFGGGTEGSVKSFQLKQDLKPTGIVDAATWGKLFPGTPPPPSPLENATLGEKCFALTGAFETGVQPPDSFSRVSGNFDGQGISFGVLQWNIGQKTLQPLLAQMVSEHEDVCKAIFHEHLDTIRAIGGEDHDEQVKFVCSASMPTPNCQVIEPWLGMLSALGRTPECRAIQSGKAAALAKNAMAACGEYGLTSERAVALMYDVQNQSPIRQLVKTQILADFQAITATDPMEIEVARMRIVANRVAMSALPRWIDDVRVRKMTIAEGQGVVHGIPYDLENVYCLTLAPFAKSNAATAD